METLLPTGRLVGGHPMKSTRNLDKHTNAPMFWSDGVTPSVTTFIAVAIPKGPETHWNQTEWGGMIQAQAQADWVNGEWQHPTFAWKIVDGDSTIPGKPFKGKPGKIPANREGYPGHWVISMQTGLDIGCYHVGKYKPHECIKDPNEIKPGDYCRVLVDFKGNGPVCESPGMYMNPKLFELSRAGELIQTGDGPDAATVFGDAPPTLPPNAAVDQGVTPPQPQPNMPGTPPPPHTAILTPPTPPTGPVMTPKAGGATYEACIAAGWTDETLRQEGMMV